LIYPFLPVGFFKIFSKCLSELDQGLIK